ncbi:MAG TPA: shikimate kinase [Actinomycetota bacterium]|nr:shikimate kinase [Actinomycetota bacterium]
MIAIVGFMGAGKSTVGRLVADELGLSFTDIDAVIEERYGPIPEIFGSGGEERFRAIERAVAREVLMGEGVVALGAGAITSAEILGLLEGATVIHLDVSLAEALRRVGDDPGRPMLGPQVQELYLSRAPVYSRVATASIRTDGLTPVDVAAALIAVVQEAGS